MNILKLSRGIEKISISLDERLVISLRKSKFLITISDRLLEEKKTFRVSLLKIIQ